MPLYKHLVIASAKASPKELASMMWKTCNVVLENGGAIHSLENHGVQALAVELGRAGGCEGECRG